MRKNYLPLFLFLVLAVGALDQLTKTWAVYKLGSHSYKSFGLFAYNYLFKLGPVGLEGFPFINISYYRPNIEVIPHWFSFYLMLNDGAAWSILSGKPILLAMISLIMIVLFGSLWYIKYQHNFVMSIGFGMMIGGALGNFIDRWRLNVVIDFLKFTLPEKVLKFPMLNDFPIFNLADAFAVSGILLIGLHLLLVELEKERKAKKKERRIITETQSEVPTKPMVDTQEIVNTDTEEKNSEPPALEEITIEEKDKQNSDDSIVKS